MKILALAALLSPLAAPAFAVKPACADAQARNRTLVWAYDNDGDAAAQTVKEVYESEFSREDSPLKGISAALRSYLDARFVDVPLFRKAVAAVGRPQSPESRREFAEVLALLDGTLTAEKILDDMKSLSPVLFTVAGQQALAELYEGRLRERSRALDAQDRVKYREVMVHLESLFCDKLAP